MRLNNLGVCVVMTALHGSVGTPINGTLYHHVLGEDGSSGPCRGSSATDKVESRHKGGLSQEDCESECTSDTNCVGYSYALDSEDGFCIIYGPGQDGLCTSHPSANILSHCGSCSVEDKSTQGECGECIIPDGSPVYAAASSYADNAGLCALRSGAWTPGSWTAGSWEQPSDGWGGDSHRTSHIHIVTPVAGYDCYDRDVADHLPRCTGTTDAGGSCAVRFAGESEGESEGAEELTEGDCTAGGAGCVYTPAPVPHVSVGYVHSPIVTGPGWNVHNVPFGDALNPEVPIALGACRSEGTEIAPPTQKDCHHTKCTASNGLSVASQEGCRQACLDCPSGACTGYSHSDFGYCVIHGPLVHLFPTHTSNNATHEWTDTWDVRERPTKFCLQNIPNNPPGCSNGDTAKPNPKYMCQTLKTSPERWQAFGAPADSHALIHIQIGTSGDVGAFTDSIKNALVDRFSTLAFWYFNNTNINVVANNDDAFENEEVKVVLDFSLLVDSTIKQPMANLMASQFNTTDDVEVLMGEVLPAGGSVVLELAINTYDCNEPDCAEMIEKFQTKASSSVDAKSDATYMWRNTCIWLVMAAASILYMM